MNIKRSQLVTKGYLPKFLREELRLGCMCHALHPDFGGKCGSCIALREDDKASEKDGEV
mgnify:CR=1 FL=1